MNEILIAIVSVAAIGLICSVLLAVASKVMHVEVDLRMSQVRDCLPGANCGACGYSGCNAFATAIVEDDAKTTLCTPGGNEVAEQINNILGLGAGEGVSKLVAVVHCIGDLDTKTEKLEYGGIRTCAAAKLLFKGQNACSFGCIGFGDCVSRCPSDAICIERGLARVDKRRCTGCGICAKFCPSKIITTEKYPASVVVMCSNTEKGGVLKDKCSAGCIGCMKCVKECPADAIRVVDFLAGIDYEKCTGCKRCIEVCPKGCIVGFHI